MKTRRLLLLMLPLLVMAGCEKENETKKSTPKDPGPGPIPYVYPDGNGDVIPDFSCVGYHYGDEDVPYITKVATTVKSPGGADATQLIQSAIDNTESGVVYLSAGTYRIAGTIVIRKSGIVLRGEGDATKLIATGKGQRNLIGKALCLR